MSSLRADIDFLREAGADDHFYGPWQGGGKASGGRPGGGAAGKADAPFSKEAALKALGQSRKDGRDEFYQEHVQAMHREGTAAVQAYLDGSVRPIASATEGDMTVHVMGQVAGENTHLYQRAGMEPVYAGKWMDFPETHWGMSNDEYRSLPIGKRAALEAKEQLRYAPSQYAGRWLETYAPVTYDEKYLGFKRGPGGDSRWKPDVGWKGLQYRAAGSPGVSATERKAARSQLVKEQEQAMKTARAAMYAGAGSK